jgi:hypothetical protein
MSQASRRVENGRKGSDTTNGYEVIGNHASYEVVLMAGPGRRYKSVFGEGEFSVSRTSCHLRRLPSGIV